MWSLRKFLNIPGRHFKIWSSFFLLDCRLPFTKGQLWPQLCPHYYITKWSYILPFSYNLNERLGLENKINIRIYEKVCFSYALVYFLFHITNRGSFIKTDLLDTGEKRKCFCYTWCSEYCCEFLCNFLSTGGLSKRKHLKYIPLSHLGF